MKQQLVWPSMLVILALQRLRLQDCCEFQGSYHYTDGPYKTNKSQKSQTMPAGNFFEGARYYYIAQAGLKLKNLLFYPSTCWDSRPVSLRLETMVEGPQKPRVDLLHKLVIYFWTHSQRIQYPPTETLVVLLLLYLQ